MRDAVAATIDCSTLNTGVTKHDRQLKSADFFAIAHYPMICGVGAGTCERSREEDSVR